MPGLSRVDLALLVAMSAVSIGPWVTARAEAPPTISGFKPHSGAVGSMVVISGKRFVPPLSITFGGGVQAGGSFTGTQITVTVPAGAISGPITVTASGGSVETHQPFKVVQEKVAGSSLGSRSLLDGLAASR